MLNRKIDKLIKEDIENGKVIDNLEQRNEFLAAENITLLEKEEYRKYQIEELNQMIEAMEKKIELQKDRLFKMQETYKIQKRLVMGGYIVFVILMCIAIA